MEIQWTLPALNEWKKIARYINKEFGSKAVQNFLKDTQTREKVLMRFPESGVLEPLLKDHPQQYHSATISKHNKIIYIITDRIYIVDVWDMRRNPSVLAKRIKR